MGPLLDGVEPWLNGRPMYTISLWTGSFAQRLPTARETARTAETSAAGALAGPEHNTRQPSALGRPEPGPVHNTRQPSALGRPELLRPMGCTRLP